MKQFIQSSDPFEDGAVDVIVAGLVLNFIPTMKISWLVCETLPLKDSTMRARSNSGVFPKRL